MRKKHLPILLALLITVSFMSPVLAFQTAPSGSAPVAKKMLIDGNNRFTSGKYAHPEIGQRRRTELTSEQHPFAVILSCSDSRFPPELIFDQGLGSLFVVRVAGNVLDTITLGSIEYAVEHLGVKLIVVLGHEKCGAVKATVDGGEFPPNIKALADKIQPAVEEAKDKHSDNLYETATDVNIINMVSSLSNDTAITYVEGVRILGAKYMLESGKVVWKHCAVDRACPSLW